MVIFSSPMRDSYKLLVASLVTQHDVCDHVSEVLERMTNRVFNQDGDFMWNYTCGNDSVHKLTCKVFRMGVVTTILICLGWATASVIMSAM